MTQESHTPPVPPGSRSGSVSTTDVVRDEAVGVGQSMKDAGDHVTHTAANQAKEVAAEASQQARNLLHAGRQQVHEQAVSGQQQVARKLITIADELREIAGGRTRSDAVRELANQGAGQLQQIASWLQNREPGDLVEEVRSFARRRPGVFLFGAALAGVAAGRLTGSGVAAIRQSGDNGSTSAQRSAYPDTSAEYPPSVAPYTAAPSTDAPTSPVPQAAVPPAAGTPAADPQPTRRMSTVPQNVPPMGVTEPAAPPCPHCAGGGTGSSTGGQVTQ